MNKNPRLWLVWLVLWAVTLFVIYTRNSMVKGDGWGTTFFVWLITLPAVLIVAFLVWLAIKALYKFIFSGRNIGITAVLIIWLGLSIFAFMLAVWNRNSTLNQPQNVIIQNSSVSQ